MEIEEKTIKGIANLIGIIGLCSGFAIMFATFMMVYFGKWCCIDINYYGEANFEFALLVFLLPFVVYTTWRNMETIYFYVFVK